jgi:hypothetical protein
MDEAMKSRVAINSIPDKVSFNDMMIKACAMALKNIRKSILHGERIQPYKPPREYWCCSRC